MNIIHTCRPKTGSITVSKVITGLPLDETFFHIVVTGQSIEPTIVDGYVSQQETITFDNLPFDTYIITEDAQDDYTLSGIVSDTVVLSRSNRNESVVVTNELIVRAFERTWDDIINAPVANPASVSDWNTYFNLPYFGTPFTSVEVIGNTVKLYGGNVTFMQLDDSHLIDIVNINILTNLQYLALYNYDNIETDQDLTGLNNLTGLALGDCSIPPDISMLTNIYSVQFYNCSSLDHIPASDIVYTFQFTNCNSYADISTLSGFANLRALAFDYCQNPPVLINEIPISGQFTGIGYTLCTGLINPPVVSGMSNLEMLYIDRCNNMTSCPNITGLTSLANVTVISNSLDSADINAMLTYFATLFPECTSVYLGQSPPKPPTPSVLATARAANPQCTFYTD